MKILSIPNESGKMTCFWEEGASSGKKPLIICLADKEEDAQRNLNLLFSQANGASVAALVVYPQTEEQIVGDWLYSLLPLHIHESPVFLSSFSMTAQNKFSLIVSIGFNF